MVVLLIALVVVAVTLGVALATGVPPHPASRSEQDDVIALLQPLPDDAKIYELGCGFGGLALRLATTFPSAHIVAVERSPFVFAVAWLRARRHPRLSVRFGDFHRLSLADADAVTAYLMIKPMPPLLEKLKRELRSGARVVALTFWFRDRVPQKKLHGAALYLFCALLFWGCTGSQYLAQAVRGQVELLQARRPLRSVVEDPKTPEKVRALLAEVPRIKAYAEAHGLAATKSYERYVSLDRKAAVWVVSAAPPLSFQARTWWFPIVGSVPYLGWFGLDEARAFAQSLKTQGLDVSLRPAAAYSTLGFFDDPILSTMLSDVGDLANTLFHESLHTTIYVPGRTDVSEGIASFVGDRMARDYLREKHPKALLEEYDADVRRGKERLTRLRQLRADLERLYASSAPDKLERKGRLLMQAKKELGWKRVLNNATLVELGNYQSGEAELEAAFSRCDNDWPRFIALLRRFVAAKRLEWNALSSF